MTNLVAQGYNDLAELYDKEWDTKLGRAEDKAIFTLIKLANQVKPGETILDLGCGTGALLGHLPISFKYYVGIDISTGLLEVAQRKYPKYNFEEMDMERLKFGKEVFDHVISPWSSFSYANNHPETAKQIKKVLKRGGRFFLQIFAPGFYHYEGHIAQELDKKVGVSLLSTKSIQAFFSWAKNLQVRGFHRGFRDPVLWEETPTTSIDQIAKLLLIESDVFGRAFPDKCMYLLVTGERP